MVLRGTLAWMLLVTSMYMLPQVATSRVVNAKVEQRETVRYEEYGRRHGAKCTAAGVADMDGDDGWGVWGSCVASSGMRSICGEDQHHSCGSG